MSENEELGKDKEDKEAEAWDGVPFDPDPQKRGWEGGWAHPELRRRLARLERELDQAETDSVCSETVCQEQHDELKRRLAELEQRLSRSGDLAAEAGDWQSSAESPPSPPSSPEDASADPSPAPDPPSEPAPPDLALTTVTALAVVAALNSMLRADPEAMAALVAHRVPCNDELADHPTCQVSPGEHPTVGLLGVLNGAMGITPDGAGYLCAELTEDGQLLGFKLTHEDQPPVADRGDDATVVSEPSLITAAEDDWRVVFPQQVDGPGLVAFEVRGSSRGACGTGFTTTDPKGTSWRCACGEPFEVRLTWTPSRLEHLSPSFETRPGSPIRVTSDRAPQIGDRVETPDGEGVVDAIGDLAPYSVRHPDNSYGEYRADELTVILVPGAESPPEPAAAPADPQPAPEPETATAPDVEPHHFTSHRNLEGVGNVALRISSKGAFTVDGKPGWCCGCGQRFNAELEMFAEDFDRDLAPGDNRDPNRLDGDVPHRWRNPNRRSAVVVAVIDDEPPRQHGQD
jgi:hypothetical protein